MGTRICLSVKSSDEATAHAVLAFAYGKRKFNIIRKKKIYLGRGQRKSKVLDRVASRNLSSITVASRLTNSLQHANFNYRLAKVRAAVQIVKKIHKKMS